MGVKKINKYHWIVNGVMTGTSVITSSDQNVQNFDNCCIQFVWTGTPVGVITVSQSVDGSHYDPLVLDPPITQPAGGGSHWSVNIAQTPAPILQVSYTNASGVGVLNAYIFSKDVN